MRGNVIRFVIALAAFAAADPSRPVIAEEHEPEATSNDSALSQGSVRIDSVVVDIERIKGALESLRNDVGDLATTSDFRNLNGRVILLLGRYKEVKTGLAKDQRRLDALHNEIKIVLENVEKIRGKSRRLEGEIKKIGGKSDDLDRKITTITNKQLAEGKAKYDYDVRLLRAHQKLLDAMRETLNTLENAIKQEAYASAVRQFTNPVSDSSLGFSILTGARRALHSLEAELNKKRVRKLGGVKFSRLAGFVTQALKSPLASATGISSISAGLSSVTSFLTSLAAREKNVSPGDLVIFNDTLEPYVAFYARLDAANERLGADLTVIQAQSRSVRVSMNNWIFERMNQLEIISELPDNLDAIAASPETTNNLLGSRGPYSADSLDARIAEITLGDQGKPDYATVALDASLQTPFLAQNQIVGIAQQLQSSVRTYRGAFIQYHASLVRVFEENTGEIKDADQKKIAKVIDDLTGKHKEALGSFDIAVNLAEISTMVSAVRAQ
ncbi:MAG: hypothetical protein OXH06_10295 [Gemmatimonadetes bacterium]|nr:hypothetical protein [Gemmatimonadota bacterium]